MLHFSFSINEWMVISCLLMWFFSHCNTIICVIFLFYLIKYSTNYCNTGSLFMLIFRHLGTTKDFAQEKQILSYAFLRILTRWLEIFTICSFLTHSLLCNKLCICCYKKLDLFYISWSLQLLHACKWCNITHTSTTCLVILVLQAKGVGNFIFGHMFSSFFRLY